MTLIRLSDLNLTLQELKTKYEEDEHLNNIPLKKFDLLAFSLPGAYVKHPNNPSFIQYSYKSMSLAEVICQMKDELRTYIEKENEHN